MNQASITYAGVPLLLDNANGDVQKWLDDYLPIADWRPTSKSQALSRGRQFSRGWFSRRRIGASLANDAPPPRPAINTLYWPTGATRWSEGWFLVARDGLKKIIDATENGAKSASLRLLDENNSFDKSIPMLMLPPQPIAAEIIGDTEPVHDLYLLTLVDSRYFLQTTGVSTVDIETWSGLFGALPVSVGTSTVPAAFGVPDPEEMVRYQENAALMLEAAANSSGRRVVAKLDGTLTISEWSIDTRDAAQASLDRLKNRRLTGGTVANTKGVYPSSATVVFPKWSEGVPVFDGSGHSVNVPASDVVTGMVGGSATQLLQTTAFYDADDGDSGYAADLQNLANAIAKAYFLPYLLKYDISFSGLQDWPQTAYDDCTIFRLGSQGPSGYQWSMRMQSLPNNWAVTEYLCQFADKPVVDDELFGELLGDLISGGSASFQYEIQADDGSLGSMMDVYSCFAPTLKSGFLIPSGSGVWVRKNHLSGRWNVLNAEECAMRVEE